MEGKGNISFMISFLLLLLLAMVSLLAGKVEGVSPARCKEERKILVKGCMPVVRGRPPSAYCCQLLRTGDAECVCSIITPKLAALIDVNYAIRVIQGCGRQVPRHYKCGSITTP
ncbi:hypothetical protein Leryth_019505 [Lithospermum erythrorhizon]|nr:hypothetical protein Leryth_019505 [Lithospermum erythrorhizon]